MKSLLPSQSKTCASQMMRIYRTQLNNFKYNNIKTNVELVDETSGKRTIASPNVYRIDDEKILGYMPSKIWHDDDGFNLLYYTSPSLPHAARPFGDKPCYAFTLFVQYGTSVEYDWQTRIFIDQIPTKVGMAYVFMFSEADAKTILQTQWDGQPWEIARPRLSAEDVSWYSEATALSVNETEMPIIKHMPDAT